MAGFGGLKKGREEARENLGYTEGGGCPVVVEMPKIPR